MGGSRSKTNQIGHILAGIDHRMHFDTTLFLPSSGLRPAPFKTSLNKLMVDESTIFKSFSRSVLGLLSDKNACTDYRWIDR